MMPSIISTLLIKYYRNEILIEVWMYALLLLINYLILHFYIYFSFNYL